MYCSAGQVDIPRFTRIIKILKTQLLLLFPCQLSRHDDACSIYVALSSEIESLNIICFSFTLFGLCLAVLLQYWNKILFLFYVQWTQPVDQAADVIDPFPTIHVDSDAFPLLNSNIENLLGPQYKHLDERWLRAVVNRMEKRSLFTQMCWLNQSVWLKCSTAAAHTNAKDFNIEIITFILTRSLDAPFISCFFHRSIAKWNQLSWSEPVEPRVDVSCNLFNQKELNEDALLGCAVCAFHRPFISSSCFVLCAAAAAWNDLLKSSHSS